MAEPMDRLKEKLTKEVLWIYILSLLKERPMYAYELKSRIREKFGFEPATVSSYVVLYKLEKDGYVTSRWQESETGKPSRKYYELTEKGKKLLDEGISFIENILEKLKS